MLKGPARPQQNGLALLKLAPTANVLTVWRIDRLGRSVKHLVDLVQQLDERDIQFRSLTEPIDTTGSGEEPFTTTRAAGVDLATIDCNLLDTRAAFAEFNYQYT